MNRMVQRLAGIAVFLMFGFGGCGGNGGGGGVSGGTDVFGITTAGNLVRFNRSNPASVANVGPITGLAGGETVVGLDFRPFNGRLYGVTSANRIVTINPSNGAATALGAAFAPGLNGSVAGVDFTPAADWIRIVTASEQNLRIDADTGATVAVDTNAAYVAGDPNAGNTPDVAAVAYTNNAHPPPATTTAFVIDTSRDVLARLGGVNGTPSANAGGLTTIGALGVDAASGSVGFDISGNGTALAVMTVGGVRGLYSVNLTTGAVTLIGPLSADVSEIAITL